MVRARVIAARERQRARFRDLRIRFRVARTIADLEGRDRIGAEHCAEAIQYRGLDRQWRG